MEREWRVAAVLGGGVHAARQVRVDDSHVDDVGFACTDALDGGVPVMTIRVYARKSTTRGMWMAVILSGHRGVTFPWRWVDDKTIVRFE